MKHNSKNKLVQHQRNLQREVQDAASEGCALRQKLKSQFLLHKDVLKSTLDFRTSSIFHNEKYFITALHLENKNLPEIQRDGDGNKITTLQSDHFCTFF